ncbi:AGE family epimerase/isomerase [Rubinisphaera italica]|uniref:Pectic acid lyase n=1 Tax=Rubinisphaera italica TaxID=2527969 RepID=A0A5C5XH71_9PLAN|nr:AGE family epimerase/isomerase [Rubinisphaera italica]TWT62516.1 Pectic acid lyase [Rubinisphaera italica]
MPLRMLFSGCVLLCLMSSPCLAQVEREQVLNTLERACDFYIENCSKHGGYDWRYSKNLKLTEGEAETDENTIWVQPPGTPAIGMSLLDAYELTGKEKYRDAALKTAEALLQGQMQSGGWYYSITFDEVERKKWGYRDNESFKLNPSRKNKTNITTLDDDTTPAAVRFMVRMDGTLKFKNSKIHDSCMFALNALIQAQHPVGGWAQNWDRHPSKPVWPKYPVLNASYPEEWSREWLNDWTGKYYLNDNVTGNMISTMLLAWEVYGDDEYLNCAKRAGDFLVRAQMPIPQQGWCQQYNEEMHPVWDRKFEPPALASDETQETIETLMMLFEKSGDKKYLQPIPSALTYLKSSLLKDGQLARFYELKTNRPLYLEVIDGKYHLTYDDSNLPTHYAFKIPAKIEKYESEYRRLTKEPIRQKSPRKPSQDRIQSIMSGLDERGAWVDSGNMKGYNKASKEGVIESETFVKNVRDLCDYLRATK